MFSMDFFGRKSKEQLRYTKRKLSHWKFVARMREQKIELLEARIVAQKEDIDRLLRHNIELANPPRYERSLEPIHMSEYEEDIQFLADTEQLDTLTARRLLQDARLESSNVEIDDGELDLTLTL